MRRLQEVLKGQEGNYILPLFWQHGEEEGILREEMQRIHESGIRAVIAEARPHPDFLGPKWWQDMDVIMEEARKRGMQVWVLDDDHFPTGRAAGRLKDAPKELRRSFLSERHIDALGPAPHASFIIDRPYVPFFAESGGGALIAVVASKRDPISGELTGESIDLSAIVKDGILHWSVPEGYWRIFIMTISDKGGSKNHEDYLNPLSAESTRVLIDTVHEAFYERYRDDFGKTFAGFFSDEPAFYNDSNQYDYESATGKKDVAMPWSKDVPERLKEVIGEDYLKQLPLLWHDQGVNPPIIRYHYMNIVSSLYGENFTSQIGDWCRERSVEYIGHVIEDNNAHTRLGAGTGHFFRALWGQDMSGVDVVLWQLAPGFDETPFKWFFGEADSEFFNYGLGKMGSSLAHLDPKKKGRTMAEVFGAYGWAEGLKLMKWLTDHMLVRGVNHFIPHSFSAKAFPDPDCPPHLYARGKNPQFRYYRYLNHYTNRLSHLLSGGTHIASAAVLYHAEAEWSGKAMYFHKPVKELLKRQIDCDVLPIDAILDSVTLEGKKLKSRDETFDCFIIPYSEALPAKCLARIGELAELGLPVIFIDALPVRASEGEDGSELLKRLTACRNVSVVPLAEVAGHLASRGFYELKTDGEYPYLRHYHIRHEDADVYFFFNEHPQLPIETNVELPTSGHICLYDAYNNRVTRVIDVVDGEDARVPLRLAPFETVVVVAGELFKDLTVQDEAVTEREQLEVSAVWSLSIVSSEQYPRFETHGKLERLVDLSRQEYLPRFTGTFRYETTVEWNNALPKNMWLDLGEVYETAEVLVNGRSAGVRISPPYRFDISGSLEQGANMLTVEVTNTLVKEHRDMFSLVAQQEPSGLLGPVRLLY
ncbi:glycosylhydrolase-like jelly roll fold domain-containing protein [Paenibacillus lutimineralis]|uniref:Glycosyl transferase family 2 n=1 Tax=Paenibacillus lutimineralis TaxID=2707005 RepID=A0A3S9UVG5_9BACL|nr:glycosylhydrolase-like jelly roll fold domain-containing protein [Paenibacillus lutimineralis]AZS14314.1 glycosyl transferase family 2 [Paenibacillus lutimineralis]